MYKKVIVGVVVLVLSSTVFAQEYKVSKTSGRLNIVEVNNVSIEGTTGNEIVFSSRSNIRENDERAKGLRAVSSMGLEDNTGLGLSVQTKGDVIEVRQLKKMDGPQITIKVPKGVVISYNHTSPHGQDFNLKNIENEVEVSTVHNGINLENVTGPLNIKSVHGDIDAVLGENLKNPISMVSVHGPIDVTLPGTVKASLKLSTTWGELFVAPELKIEMDTKGDMVRYSDQFSGKINGGGIEINLSSTHNNVYLRKK
ncbi:DUF4097 family beta strand repeat-containing protein [Chryseosolibacter indicus]|uniref:Adhesin domain-containing protein n=1 Tax=Chryseosolibacter indicus TaxID=2782351 RepID=A0ABS5VQW5_9BACT|nr:DUF4097 family beta strand repeat-containing protein [Chryseosolibacter indicus]MBT1703845.1 hypothetical protein [Chryseosolibacter indicus]